MKKTAIHLLCCVLFLGCGTGINNNKNISDLEFLQLKTSFVDLYENNLDLSVYKGNKIVINYWATWCGPCKMVGPIVEEIAIEFSDKIKVGKLDVDANQTSAAQQNVMSITTLAIFKGGELVAQQVGALSKTQLTDFIESNL